MKYLFNAVSEMDEQMIHEMVSRTISVLRAVPDDRMTADVGFDLTSAHIVANLIDLGAAPHTTDITDRMRSKANKQGVVHISMKPSHAHDMARLIEVGLIRHQHGVDTPEGFRLH
ncbi:hypothetical protein [Pseudosulfitobacter pseudonitzschiae]|uniref:hypothetical protein n=1 Tax=Pseudosulfitobacter pseudonitzschiae TaxID=1402135 RepID=UPI003B314146